MKRKAISILATGLVMASLAGCGTQAETADSVVPGQSPNETVVVGGEEIAATNEANSNTDPADGGSTVDGNGYIVFYGDQQGVSEEVDLSSLNVLEPAVELHFNADTDVYDTDGNLAGYVRAGAYVSFNKYNEKWSSFEFEGADMFIKMDELQNNAVNENLVETTADTPALMEEVTDGNIVLYGGEKNPAKYGGLGEGIGEEINVVLTNVEADIPLFSGDGCLCGHLKEGGSIVITEHCTVATAWYRFPNPIEGTEYDYLYLLRYETVMSRDEKEDIEKILRDADDLGRTEILDAPDSDMECYEFSIARQDYHKIGGMLYEHGVIQYGDWDRLVYNTFYVECTRDGDFFDCKVYYK